MRPGLAVALLALYGPATAQSGLVNWVAKESTLPPQAALHLLVRRPGELEVR